MVAWASERGLALHLGGGYRPGDNLEQFKRGFANREGRFYNHPIVADPRSYAELSANRPPAEFFPTYRN